MNYETEAVALIQRSIPHYRIPLFERLAADPRFSWTFYCGPHDQSASSGLTASLAGLETRPIVERRIGKFVVQTGIPVSLAVHNAIMVDYGWPILSNPVLFARAHARGVATVGWSKGIAQDTRLSKHRLRRAFERASVSLCDSLVVYGELSRDYFLELGYPRERIFVAQNTIDTRHIVAQRDIAKQAGLELRRELGFDERPVIGFLGKIGKAKRVDCLIAAFERARAIGVDAQLLVAGRGPDSGAVEAAILASPYASDIRRLTDVPPGTESSVFQVMDLYASYAEAGLGVLEAMAHAVPVVATPERYPETELLADGDSAFVSSKASVASFADAIARAVNNGVERRAVAERAEQIVLERATLEAMVESISGAVRAAIDFRTGKRGDRSITRSLARSKFN